MSNYTFKTNRLIDLIRSTTVFASKPFAMVRDHLPSDASGLCLSLILLLFSMALQTTQSAKAQSVELRTNLLYWGTTTPNAGIGVRVGDHWSLSLQGGHNPFRFPQWRDADENVYNPKLLHWGVMPEAKYWLCRAYERSYIGLYGLYGQYNVGGLRMIDPLRATRYEGYAYGGGISYGYHFAVGKRCGLELSLGIGYARLCYRRCDAYVCGDIGDYRYRNYWGPTKAEISFVYFIK